MNFDFFKAFIFYVLTASFSSLLYAETKTVWIDVRSIVEHRISNIEGDIRVSHSEVVGVANRLFPDRNTAIRLYCLSGGRAEKAVIALKKAGYSNVRNVGGISDARRERAITDAGQE